MRSGIAAIVLAVLATAPAAAQGRGGNQPPPIQGPWMDKSLSPDRRAELLLAQMTMDEKITLVHGNGMGFGAAAAPSVSNGGAGYVLSIPRLGIPAIQMADAAVGVTRGAARGRYSTALPSNVAEASAWDTALACQYGALIGRELRDQGYTMSLGGGVNLAREPRNGRTFEYKGEDPILAGSLAAEEMKCLQAEGIIGDIKHFAANDQETGRNIGNVILNKRVLRETDLLPFEIALKQTEIGGVMCSYNKVNGDWACENQYLLNNFLKQAVGYQGFVVSDWGGTHSTVKSALAGLDMEQPGSTYFGEKLREAVEKGEVPSDRLNDMVKRILRAQFAAGQFDNRMPTRVPDVFGGLEFAARVAQRGTVLLKNDNHLLPLNASHLKSIAIIGSHADAGVLSGGGSAQVDPPGGNAVPPAPPAPGSPPPAGGMFRGVVWYPSSPVKAISAKAPLAKVQFNDGTDVAAAAAMAKASDVAIVFANQPASEGRDLASLSLPENQDRLVEAVAAANPRTIVVLETGGAVTMPWISSVGAALEAWYPGIRGAEAIADILFGAVNPSGKLVLSFPKTEADLPHAKPFGPAEAASPAPAGGTPAFGRQGSPFDILYSEGLQVGYKWYDAQDKVPLFPFGHGLSFTTYAYSGMHASGGQKPQVVFTLKNTGARAGIEIAQVYATLPASAGEPPKRLVAWQPVELQAGESKTVTLAIDPFHLSIFNETSDAWQLVPGDYKVWVGASSRNLLLSATMRIGD